MSKASSGGRVTLPVGVLQEAGIAAGDEIIIRAIGQGRVEIERAEDAIDHFAGRFPAGTYPPGDLDRLQDEWRR